MGRYVPSVNSNIFEALPPGHTLQRKAQLQLPDFTNRPLRLFYVGGMSSHYQMHKLFSAVQVVSNVELTICTRKAEWLSVKKEYPQLTPNIKIVHLSGAEMEAKLEEADVALLFVKPQEYWEFASPVKLYEYLGYHKPVLASEGTLTGRFVRENGVGWTVSYSVEAVVELLKNLLFDPTSFNFVYQNLHYIAPQHTWQTRANQVVQGLYSENRPFGSCFLRPHNPVGKWFGRSRHAGAFDKSAATGRGNRFSCTGVYVPFSWSVGLFYYGTGN